LSSSSTGETNHDHETDVANGRRGDCSRLAGARSRCHDHADDNHADRAGGDHHYAEHDANDDDPADHHARGAAGDDDSDDDHADPADHDA
jgi:hypothetical protein